MKKTIMAALMISALCIGTASAAEIQLVNVDPAGKGLNDLTPLAPAGGNPGTTIGEQRRIVYQFAMDLWGSVLNSDTPIRVQASFAALECGERTVLGSAGANLTHTTGGLGYPIALANARAGKDLLAGTRYEGVPHVISRFNASFGLTTPDGQPCSPDSGWYYGLDGKAPSNRVDFLSTVLHEIAHGLGFAGSRTSGTDIYNQKVFANEVGKLWPALTTSQRTTQSTSGNIVYTGANVVAETPLVLGPKQGLKFSGAVDLVVDRFGTAAFGPKVTLDNFMGPLVMAGAGANEACEALPAGSLTGKVAFVNRGGCSFDVKVNFAQGAGAIGVVIGNVASSDTPNGLVNMVSSDDSLVITIPTVQLRLTDADVVRAAAGDTMVAYGIVGEGLAGADKDGRPFLYAPSPVVQGSSFSHYDTSLFPNALMEPSDTGDLVAHIDLDLTPALFADEGWVRNTGNGHIGTCDTGVRAVVPGGIVIGANLQAQARVCLLQAKASRAGYLRCMTDHATTLKRAGLINNAQFAAVRTCAGKINPAD